MTGNNEVAEAVEVTETVEAAEVVEAVETAETAEVTEQTEAVGAAPKPETPSKLILRLTLSLLAITSAVALLLAGVNALTKDKIAEYAAEKRAAAMAEVLPSERAWLDFDSVEITVGSSKSGATVTPMVDGFSSHHDLNGLPHALCVETYPSGYGGAIQLMVGISVTPDDLSDPQNYSLAVTAVRIVSHSETSGIGSKTADPSFLDQYSGKTAGITIGAGDNSISAISGASVSSKAVTAGVNEALDAANQYIAKVLAGELPGVISEEGGDAQ